MATVLNDLVTFLAAALPAEVVRRGYIPTSPDRVIAFVELIGDEPLATMPGRCGYRMESPNIQVRARAVKDDYEAARDLAQDAFNALHDQVRLTISGTKYSLIEALQSPYNLGIDEESRWTCGFTLRCWKEPNA